MKITVSVTAEDIKHGERGKCCHCPIAQAISRATGGQVWGIHVQNGKCAAFRHGTTFAEMPRADLPHHCANFVAHFDAYGPGRVVPFTFDAEFPTAEMAVDK